MRAGFRASAQALQALAEREVRVVGRRIDLEQRLEGDPGALMASRVEVRTTQRLQDGGLAGFQSRGPLEDDGRLRVVPAIEQLVAALEELVRALALVVGVRFAAVSFVHAQMVARTPPDVVPGSVLAPGGQVDGLEARRVRQARDAAALGDRAPIDLLDVAGEVDRRRAADVRPDRV